MSSLLRRGHEKAGRDLARKAPIGMLRRLASSYEGEMPKLALAARSMADAFDESDNESQDRAAARLSKAASRIGF